MCDCRRGRRCISWPDSECGCDRHGAYCRADGQRQIGRGDRRGAGDRRGRRQRGLDAGLSRTADPVGTADGGRRGGGGASAVRHGRRAGTLFGGALAGGGARRAGRHPCRRAARHRDRRDRALFQGADRGTVRRAVQRGGGPGRRAGAPGRTGAGSLPCRAGAARPRLGAAQPRRHPADAARLGGGDALGPRPRRSCRCASRSGA